MKYLGMCLFFLAGSEILSLLALLIMAGMFLADVMKERMEKYE